MMFGIDVSKTHLQYCLLEAHSRLPLREGKVSNDASGISELLSFTPSGVSWVIEPTGRYSFAAVETASSVRQRVLLAPTRRAKSFLASIQDRAKTDRLDAKGLAQFGLSVPLSEYPLPEKSVRTVNQLLSARKGLTDSISKLQQQQQELPPAKEFLAPAIFALKEQVKLLDQQIETHRKQESLFSGVDALVKVPGIGKLTATAVIATLADKQFDHPDKFVAYIGMDVTVRDSGKHIGKRKISHQGKAELRRLLYLCAQATLRTKADNPFKTYYKQQRDKGLSSTASLCIVARKMAKLCWSMHKHNTQYDPQRVPLEKKYYQQLQNTLDK